MAYKVFTNGSVLQASEINENLMRQSVMVFSNAAARTAAITSPVEGMVAYLEDVDLITIYQGGSWKTSLSPTGGVLQVVTAQTATQVTNSTNTLAATGLTATITPKSISSRILVMVNQNGIYKGNGHLGNGTTLILQKNSAQVSIIGAFLGYTGTTIENYDSASQIFVESPGSLAPITYRTVFANQSNNSVVSVQQSNALSTMTVMEIAS